jgi:hypothetical protein
MQTTKYLTHYIDGLNGHTKLGNRTLKLVAREISIGRQPI